MKFDNIDLWYGDILPQGQIAQQFWSFLDEEEKIRAEQLKIERMRDRFIAVRAKVRLKLAEYTGEQVERIRFTKYEFGKSTLVNADHLFFNISHSENKLLIAVGLFNQLGVDIEVWKQRANIEKLVGKCFSPEELIIWNNLTEQEKTPAFYAAWTKKEAFVKAVGRGITLGLDQCVIAQQHDSQFFSVPAEYLPASDWQVIALELEERISAAVVVRGKQIHYKLKIF